MSYSGFSTTNYLTVDLGAATRTYPVFIAAWVKYTTHPESLRAVTYFSNNVTSYSNALSLASSSADGVFLALSRDGASTNSTASYDTTNLTYKDGVWFPMCAVFTADSGTDARRIYVDTVAQTAVGTSTKVVDTGLRYILIGGPNVFWPGKVGEVVVGLFNPNTATDLAAYFSGTSAVDVWGGQSSWWYYPLDEASGLADISGNSGPALTVVGTPTSDVDHPVITSTAAEWNLVTEPLYYGATRLDNKTGIRYAIRSGHTDLTGPLLLSGTNATTNASGVIQLPTLSEGAAADPVTLHLYWEEGSDPAVDRSLIVKTTLVAA